MIDKKKADYKGDDADYGGGADEKEQQRHWMNQIQGAQKEIEPWHERGQKIIDIYLDKKGKRSNRRKFNMFSANTNNLLSALFGRIPQPDISRRFRDPNDHYGRVAANILQRGIARSLETDAYFASIAKNIIKDKLIPGGGFAWVRYKNDVSNAAKNKEDQPFQITDNVDDESAEIDDSSPIISNERTPVEHINWKDFLWSPARSWAEVTWVARRSFLDKNEFKERFPSFKDLVEHETLDDIAKAHRDDDLTKQSEVEVWEIWCKTAKKVYFYTDRADKILDCQDDPYGLPHFFPCPKPLFATVSTSKLMPVPDYAFVQDQYEQLNELNERKSSLIAACKVVGVYDAENIEMKDMLEGPENRMIAVKNFAAFAEKGGVNNAVQFMQMNQISAVIAQIDAAMNAIKAQIDELTGISDIVRGSTSPYETASAQGMKGQYASIRFNSQQTEVAEFFSELLNIKAFLMAKMYQPETLLREAGMLPVENVPNHADLMYAEGAIKLLQDELLSNITVQVSVDALQAGNDATVMRQKSEVMAAISTLIGQAFPVIQAMPESKEMFLHMIKANIAGMPGAKELEGVLDQQLTKLLMPQAPEGPDPAAMAAQQQQAAAQQAAEQAAQMEQAKMQAQQQLEQAKLQQTMMIEEAKGKAMVGMKQMELEHATGMAEMKNVAEAAAIQAKADIEKRKLDIEERKLRLEELKAIQESGGQIDMSELELPVGEGMASQRAESQNMLMQFMQQMNESNMQFQAQQQERLASMMAALATPAEPLAVSIIRDENGRMVGAKEI